MDLIAHPSPVDIPTLRVVGEWVPTGVGKRDDPEGDTVEATRLCGKAKCTSASTRVHVPPRVTGGVGTDTRTAVCTTSREGTVD